MENGAGKNIWHVISWSLFNFQAAAQNRKVKQPHFRQLMKPTHANKYLEFTSFPGQQQMKRSETFSIRSDKYLSSRKKAKFWQASRDIFHRVGKLCCLLTGVNRVDMWLTWSDVLGNFVDTVKRIGVDAFRLQNIVMFCPELTLSFPTFVAIESGTPCGRHLTL